MRPVSSGSTNNGIASPGFGAFSPALCFVQARDQPIDHGFGSGRMRLTDSTNRARRSFIDPSKSRAC